MSWLFNHIFNKAIQIGTGVDPKLGSTDKTIDASSLPGSSSTLVGSGSSYGNGSSIGDYLKRTLDIQKWAADYNAVEAQKNRDFQERMSNTAYSRAIADIKRAGYNPYAIFGSSQASTPSGSASSVSSGSNMQSVASLINSISGVVSAVSTSKFNQTRVLEILSRLI